MGLCYNSPRKLAHLPTCGPLPEARSLEPACPAHTRSGRPLPVLPWERRAALTSAACAPGLEAGHVKLGSGGSGGGCPGVRAPPGGPVPPTLKVSAALNPPPAKAGSQADCSHMHGSAGQRALVGPWKGRRVWQVRGPRVLVSHQLRESCALSGEAALTGALGWTLPASGSGLWTQRSSVVLLRPTF